MGEAGVLKVEPSGFGVSEEALNAPALRGQAAIAVRAERFETTMRDAPEGRRLAAIVSRWRPRSAPAPSRARRILGRVRQGRRALSVSSQPSSVVTRRSPFRRMAKGMLFSQRKSIHAQPMNSRSPSRHRIVAALKTLR